MAKYFTVKQQHEWHSGSRVCWTICLLRPFLDCFSASTPKKPAKRGPKPKQIGTSGYCRTCGCFVYVNGTVQLTRSLKLQRIFCFSQTEDQSSRVCSHCSNQVGSTRAGFSFFKASFQEREHDDDTLRTECPHQLMVPLYGNAMTQTPASLIAWTWSLIVLRNGDATTILRSFLRRLSFTAANNC